MLSSPYIPPWGSRMHSWADSSRNNTDWRRGMFLSWTQQAFSAHWQLLFPLAVLGQEPQKGKLEASESIWSEHSAKTYNSLSAALGHKHGCTHKRTHTHTHLWHLCHYLYLKWLCRGLLFTYRSSWNTMSRWFVRTNTEDEGSNWGQQTKSML